MKICLFGHSTIFNDLEISKRLIKAIEKLTFDTLELYFGTHGDFDNLCFYTLKQLSDNNKKISIHIVLSSPRPYKKYKYKPSKIDKYKGFETFSFDIDEIHFKQQIIVTNQKMVDKCDICICYINPNKTYGGALKTFKHARSQNKEIINIFDINDLPY